MSATLQWRPADSGYHDLDHELRFILQKSLLQDSKAHIFDEADVPYFQGLADAEVKGAEELLTAIQQHKRVEVTLRW